MASRAELLEALFRDHVPEALAENWIDSQRPLIPFRTIPAMITAGILSEADGLRLIQEHGFSLENAVLLLRYATRQSKTTKAATATAQKTVSEAQAKTAYEDGLIGRDQYLTLLEAHGWAPAAALLEVQLTDIAIETKDRKQVSTDIVNQYEAGMIDQQTALQLLAQSGLTPAEQAAAAKKLTSAKSAKAKIPSEAELRAFALHDIITPDDYQSTLVVLGYSEAWAAAFRALHFPIVPPPAAATA
jgi:phage gp36-like protein